MLNEDLIFRAADMILSRVRHYDKLAEESTSHAVRSDTLARAAAYKSAYDILHYAINNNEECLKEFDYYT